jgi:hypothetical protein
VRVRFLFRPLAWAFNLAGLAGLVIDTARARIFRQWPDSFRGERD